MAGSKIINHKGKEIVFNDYAQLKTAESVQKVIKQAAEIIQVQKPATVLSLINFEGTHFNKPIINALSKAAQDNKPYIKASAIYGVSGLGRIIIDGVIKLTGRNLPTFSSEEEAKDYLVSQ
jgi:hypothetical protein